MESKLLVANTCTLPVFIVYKYLNSHSAPLTAQLHRSFLAARPSQIYSLCYELRSFGSGSLVKRLGSVELCGRGLQFAASYSSSFAPAGGGFDGFNGNSSGDGGGGKGDGAAEGGDTNHSAVPAEEGDASFLSSDVIILEVGGMTCGGCAASVRRILESQAQVSSASVNLTTETAIVWPVPDAMFAPNWRKDLGEALAKHLTSCGFKSNLRADGVVRSGRSSVDESSFTGEPLPVTKLPRLGV